jgi:hypothetical protein
MAPHFVLFEHAAGYALFKLKEFEEVATFLPQVEESVLDVSKFSQVTKPFNEAQVASPITCSYSYFVLSFLSIIGSILLKK